MKNEDMEKLTFEDALQKLEVIVRELETGQIKLDDAVKVYEEGVRLKKLCEKKLSDAQMKVEKLVLNKQNQPIGVEALDE
ncbi:MAG: exodeoxyribonuclease VII small subunit [Alphaproteobacteria bacterium]|nr:exodeoxyribonuclease VII small subunit [Alphaproteobacteria bacterium]